MDQGTQQMKIAAVVIGRNEGARLIACLQALEGQIDQIIYVDSGSTDDSVGAAQKLGAHVISLDMTQPFTAARARNIGINSVEKDTDYIQFLDGDCVLQEGWLAAAGDFLTGHPEVAVVCGRRRERFVEASVYNRLIDAEWDTAIGEAKACGGDALMRKDAVIAVGGYRDTLIAGEEPEMCVRLRAAGWKIWRLDAEMTWHDAAITKFSQWWKRSKRAGHAFAEGAALHGGAPEKHWVTETKRALVWGAALPLTIAVLTFFVSPLCVLLALIYPLQVLRLSRQGGLLWAFFTTLSKFAEARGALQFYVNRLRKGPSEIIEYK
jgi:GT2 family glycosyltransferase